MTLRFLVLSLALAMPSLADQGAVTLAVGGGASLLRVSAPYAEPGAAQTGSAPAVWLDGRYGLTNNLQLVASAFGETSVPFYVSSATIDSDAGKLTGTLQMRARRVGALVGARWLQGNVWRLVLGADIGWSLSSYSSMHLIDEADPSGARDFGLVLADKNVNSLVLAPSVGISWVGDKLSVTVLPRFEALLGGGTTWAITVPVTIGWDWYL